MGRRRQRKLFVPLERDIQAAVVEHWRLLGGPHTLVGAIPNQNAHGQPGLTPGLPDLIVMGEGVPGRIALVELKRDGQSPLSDAQKDIRDLCSRLGITWRVARGRDEPIAILEAWGVVRMSADSVGGERPADPRGGSAGAQEGERRLGV
jgi:hypothetical protein